MKLLRGLAALALSVGFCPTGSSAGLSYSTGNNQDIKFRWEVSTESNNVYFKLDAPVAYSWVALGIGNSMQTAEIFLMYQDGEGNVTLSTRKGRNHIMPVYEERSGVELISGSGVLNDRMTAKVRCSDCNKLDLEGENNWVAAWLSGETIQSSSVQEPIDHHEGRDLFSIDLAMAATDSEVNPLADSDDDNDILSSGAVVTDATVAKYDSIRLAHGIIMTVVFVAMYPIGALLMPVFGNWFLHSASQLLAFILMWAGVGLGATFARQYYLYGRQAHTIIGSLVVILLCLQPVLGILHSRHYAKHEGRGHVGIVHVWYGRSLMLLGVLNGGLGLQLAGHRGSAWVIAYSVIAGLAFASYLASIIFSIRKYSRRKQEPSEADLNRNWPPSNLSLDSYLTQEGPHR
ncbi:unnamed protein product [Clonostachys rhizophaga]|uniref:DOMON domain-containing protein n=1 Tax=Clonostachys rhizophaga TaxID=160324 RepID=A0A9N9YKK3_9HYPO|nr:unnamed protein product [Clonostachys rhizophaga]